jgi:formylglycine-generating enzyme required for sulfatase activity
MLEVGTTRRWVWALLALAAWPSGPAAAAEGHRFAVVVETAGLPAAVKSRLEGAIEGLLGEVPGAECVARDDVRSALADARTETNQKCASGKLDSRCQIALGKGVDANYVAKLDVRKQGKSCDVVLSVFSIAEETQKASATELGTSCDSDALTKGLRSLVDRAASKLGLGRSVAGDRDPQAFDLGGGAPVGGETDFDRQLKALEARRAQEEATWTALTKELPKLGDAGQRSKLEAYLKLVGDSGPHADEAKAKLAALREAEASAKLAKLRPVLTAAGTRLEDKRSLVGSFVGEYGGTRAAGEAQGLLAEAERAEAQRQAAARPAGKGAAGSYGVEWVWSAPAGVAFTKSEVTVGQYEACVKAGRCGRDTFQSTSDYGYCNWGSNRGGSQPMNCVNWFGAQAFCEAAGGTLPSEAQWFAEASNGNTRQFPWGDLGVTCDLAVMNNGTDGCGRDSTWPVCSKPRGHSVSGLCDMSGNVWEWTSDSDSAKRVLRGGSWLFDAQDYLRASARTSTAPDDRGNYLGFRCARASRE